MNTPRRPSLEDRMRLQQLEEREADGTITADEVAELENLREKRDDA